MRTSQQIGKDFEKTLEGVFSSMRDKYGFMFHKFVDTKAAGNVVASQPADYLIGTPGQLSFMEAKSSDKVPNFRRSMLRPAQRGAIIQYSVGLGIPYHILFEHKGRVDFISTLNLFEHKKLNVKRVTIFSLPVEALEDNLAQWFGLLPKKRMIERIESYAKAI